jgi:Lanthionine synthetase C-like protein
MFDTARHVPLRAVEWVASEVQAAIDEIVADALTQFSETHFWPAHPQDDGAEDGETCMYFGATGVIWAIDYLARAGAIRHSCDFVPLLNPLIDASRRRFAKLDYGEHGSLLLGDLGTLLVAMRLRPDAATADAIHKRASANNSLPIRELMWGLPGSMLACIFMSEMTGESRWRELYAIQAARLLEELVETELGPLWTQELYGSRQRWLGSVHGYAGNMAALIRGWGWLGEEQCARIADAVPRTLAANAVRSKLGAQWHAIAGAAGEPRLCQHCHGAPGMVTTFAAAPFSTPEFEALLVAGGEITWHAGPLAKGSNLCHGTAGNGYAFLKLHRRTRNARWLARAQAFAMTAAAQCREARAQQGRGRYSLWTGDLGLAVYLWDCMTGEPRFPTVDVL